MWGGVGGDALFQGAVRLGGLGGSGGGSGGLRSAEPGARVAGGRGRVMQAEVMPGPRRAKKRKGTGRELPEMLGKAVPESDLYKNLQMLERRADAMLARKRVDVQAALAKTPVQRRTLRIWVYSTRGGSDNQTPEARDEPRIALEAAEDAPVERVYEQGGAEAGVELARDSKGANEGTGADSVVGGGASGGSGGCGAALAGTDGGAASAPGVRDDDVWTLNVYGQILPRELPGGGRGGSAEPDWLLSSLLRRLEMRFEGETSPVAGRSVVWEGSAYDGEPRKCFMAHSPGKPEGTATVLLWPNWLPMRYKVPEALAQVIGTDVETKPRIVAKLWKYIQMMDLQSTSDPTKFLCDANLEEVFKAPSVDFASIDAVLNGYLSEPEPVQVLHHLKPDGPSPSRPECVDIEIDVPLPSNEPESLMKLLDVSKKVKALDQKLSAAMKELEEHKNRRFFYLAFSHSPADFIRSLLESQQRDLDLLQAAGTESDAALTSTDRDAAFSQSWVPDAACKYLQRRASRVGGAL